MESEQLNKNSLHKLLLQTLITALEKDKINRDNLRTISTYILDRLDNVETHSEALNFLTKLAKKHPIFKDILNFEQKKFQELKEQDKVKHIEQMLRENNIDAALQEAETAEDL